MSRNKHLKLFFIVAITIIAVGNFLIKQDVLAAPFENLSIDNTNISHENSLATDQALGVSSVGIVYPILLTATGGGIGRPGPILSKVRVVNGKKVCRTNNDHPHKSTNGNRPGHIDGECCLDPDETPNSNCYYPQPKYTSMIQKYLNRLKHANKAK